MFELGIILLILIVCSIAITVVSRERHTLLEGKKKSVVDELLRLIQNGSLEIGDLTRTCAAQALGRNSKKQVAIRTYRTCFSAVANGRQQINLDDLAHRLMLNAGDRDIAELPVKQKELLSTWQDITRHGPPSSSDISRLQKLRSQLNITDWFTNEQIGKEALSVYQKAYCRFVASRTPLNTTYLEELRLATGMSCKTARGVAMPVAISFFQQRADQVLSNKAASIANIAELGSLLSDLGLTREDVTDTWRRLERTAHLAILRSGNLPKVSVTASMRGTESCHFHQQAAFNWPTKGGNWRSASGDLFVTSQRIIFTTLESNRSFEFSVMNILDVSSHRMGIQIRCTTSKGAGVYAVRDAEILEAILAGTMRNMRSGKTNSYAPRTRAIPTEVKQAVFLRDGGVCVLCGAGDDIQYDHDLPFSKGGSNTVENIRLLCASCNLRKRDRIE